MNLAEPSLIHKIKLVGDFCLNLTILFFFYSLVVCEQGT